MHLDVFYYMNVSRCTVLRMSKLEDTLQNIWQFCYWPRILRKTDRLNYKILLYLLCNIFFVFRNICSYRNYNNTVTICTFITLMQYITKPTPISNLIFFLPQYKYLFKHSFSVYFWSPIAEFNCLTHFIFRSLFRILFEILVNYVLFNFVKACCLK